LGETNSQDRFHLAEGKRVQLFITETFSDIQSRIHIRVTNEAAVLTDKLGLRAAVQARHKSAVGALLTGIGRLHGAITDAPLIQLETEFVSDVSQL
jgi:hypothetical protein